MDIFIYICTGGPDVATSLGCSVKGVGQIWNEPVLTKIYFDKSGGANCG